MIKVLQKRPSPLRSRSEDEEDFCSSLPSLTVESAPAATNREPAIFLEKPARKFAKSCSFDLEQQCDLFPDVVNISSKRRDTIQLRRSDKRRNSKEKENSPLNNSCSSRSQELWQDSLLPRGSLTLACHSMDMGPVGRIEAALFRNKYRVAIKKHDSRTEEKIQKELALLKYLGNYPTILSCYGYVNPLNATSHSMQIVYELAPYGTLDEILKANKIQSFPLSLIIAWLSDLADAIQFLHSKGIVHGDIQTNNLLVFERMDVKLCNFSSAYAITDRAKLDGNNRLEEITSKIAEIGFQKDMQGFFLTAIHIFTSKSFEEVRQLFDNTTIKFREKKLQEFLLNRPCGEINTFQKLYNILLNAVDFSNYHRMKEISVQLFAVLEEYFDGDPREPLNEYYKKLQRFELLIKSHVDNLVPLPPRSRLRQKLFGSSTFVKNQHNNYPLEALMEITSNKVMDPRTKLAEWFLNEDFNCSFVEAEEISTYFLRNGFGSKEEILREGLSATMKGLIQPSDMISSEFSTKLLNQLFQTQ